MADDMDARIRQVVATYGSLVVDISTVGDHDDLVDAGMTSYANVNVMLALEEAFGIDFPEQVLRRSTFGSIAGIREVVSALVAEGAVA